MNHTPLSPAQIIEQQRKQINELYDKLYAAEKEVFKLKKQLAKVEALK